ncbi:MAG: bifunctional metallophosphatase/5'-nucleotidase [Halanaerobiaceae bacterium]
MQWIKSGFFPILILLVVLLFIPVRQSNAEEEIIITHLNDIHSMILPFNEEGGRENVGGIARIANVLDEIRAENENVLFLNAGDIVAGSGDIYQEDYDLPLFGYRGLLEVELMNELGLDAMVPGNHEYDFGLRWTERLFEEAEFEVLSANARYLTANEGDSIYEPYKVFELGGTEVGVIGISTDDYIQSSQINESDQIDALAEQVPVLEEKADIVVVLSHLGKDMDMEVAREVEGIDVIVGGHSHTEIDEPLRVGGTLITQAGIYGKSLGKLKLEIEEGQIVDDDYRRILIDESVNSDREIEQLIEERSKVGEFVYSGLKSSTEEQSTLGNFITNAMCWYTGADIALVNSRVAEGELERGDIPASDFFEVFWPHRSRSVGPEKDLDEEQVVQMVKNRREGGQREIPLDIIIDDSDRLESIVTLQLTGKELMEILEANREIRGTGDYLQVSGLGEEYSADSYHLEPDRDYEVAMNLNLALGRGDFKQLWQPDEFKIKDKEVFEVVLDYLELLKVALI